MTRKILVADDSVTIHKIVGLTFAGEDLAIECAMNGTEAVEKALTVKPDLVLADVSMPGLNGYQVCEQIKASRDLSQVPVVLLVGSFERFDAGEASRIKCDGHLTKPFDTSELIQIVKSLISRVSKADQLGNTKIRGKRKTPPSDPAMATNLVSAKTRESFLGAERILDVFGGLLPMRLSVSVPVAKAAPEQVDGASTVPAKAMSASSVDEVGMPSVGTAANGMTGFPDGVLDVIVEKVVRQMSRDVVREVAWEVVPELAESLIRQWLKEHAAAEPTGKSVESAAPHP